MKFIDSEHIEINRELSDLDKFTIEFTNILKKYIDYVIISGYVAIVLGRARASEDVGIIIPRVDFSDFKKLYGNLKENGFYCLNAEEEEIVYSYLEENLAIRFAKLDTIIPNIELKWIKNDFDRIALKKTIDVTIKDKHICISNLELQIAFKEVILKSPKDLEDAQHLRSVAKEYLDFDLIQEYKENLHEFY
ncbi:MAG TPA: hypothetical protein VKP59_00530 [Candidatus Thermoplasmatota archaeon]|nr:hypothetical protein [Candidatus Thermoplasmatota archaeon]